MSGTELFATFLGSVALLLWGVRMVRTGMTRAFGSQLRRAISTYARTRIGGFIAGVGITGILQSSTATTMLLASFTARGLIALPIALAVVLGADVGSAIVAQVFSLDVKWLWTVLVALGVLVFMSTEADRARGVARIFIGLGLMLLALVHIGLAAAPLKDSALFRSLLTGLAGEPVLGFLAATAVAWLVHSSLSVVLLVMALAAARRPARPARARAGAGRERRRRTCTVPHALRPSARRPPRAARQSDHAHRGRAPGPLFGDADCDVARDDRIRSGTHRDQLPHGVQSRGRRRLPAPRGAGGDACDALLPDLPQTATSNEPKHLDPTVLDTPSEALGCAMRETLHMGDRVAEMMRQALVAFEKSDQKFVKEVEKADNVVDALHEAIKLYMVKLSKAEMTDEESQRYVEIITFTTNLEHVGDIIDKNLMELATKKIKNRYTFSSEGLDEIRHFHARVMDNMRLAFNVFATRDVAMARRLLAEKAVTRTAELAAADSHFGAAARGPAGIAGDQRDPSRRDARPQAHQRAPDLGRLSDPGGRGRIARQPPARARGGRRAGAERQAGDFVNREAA